MKNSQDPTTTLLAVITNPGDTAGIRWLSMILAQKYRAEVIVLRTYRRYTRFREFQRDLSGDPGVATMVGSLREAGVPVRAMAAPGEDLGRAIRASARQVHASAILIQWAITGAPDDYQTHTALDALLEDPPADLYILDEQASGPWKEILVPVSSNPNTPLALQTALGIADMSGGHVTAFHMIGEELNQGAVDVFEHPESMHGVDPGRRQARANQLAKTKEDLLERLGELGEHPRLNIKLSYGLEPADEIVKEFQTLPEGVDDGSVQSRYDAVILGASHESLIDPALLGGIPAEVARSLQLPVLIVKRRADPVSGKVIAAWRKVYELLPKVTVRESVEVVEAVERAAYPRLDFFIMSGLAAVIATLGLLMNSPAVVIGAMLVEPLLAAITGIGLGIVEGDTPLVRNSLVASLRGLLIAVVISFFLTLVVPDAKATDEVLLFTRPTLFDLGIAMASGMAGAYAVARKELSAALPGVAISVSLVPPLGTLGIGLALADLTIVLGSALTFATNFIAIVVMGSLVFLLLGFGPNTGRLAEHIATRRGLFWEALLSLVLVVVLGLLTARLLSESFLSNAIDNHLQELVRTEFGGEVIEHDYTISEEDGETLNLDVAIRSPRPLELDDARALQEEIAGRLQRPVALRLSVVQAALLAPVPPPTPTASP